MVNYKEIIIKGFLISVSSLAGASLFFAFDYLSARYTRLNKATTMKEKIVNVDFSQEPGKPLLRHRQYWYELKPNLNRYVYFGNYKFKVATNEHGFRVNHKIKAKIKPSETLFLIGDSFTFGSGLNWDDTYPGILEKNSPWNVINAGVQSHSPSGYAFRLKKSIEKGLVPEASTIIMAVDISDVQDESAIWTDTVIENLHTNRQKPSTPRNSQSNNSKLSLNDNKLQSQAGPPEKISIEERLRRFTAKNLPKTLGIIRGIRMQLGLLQEPIAELDRSAFTFKDWSELEFSYAPLGVKGGLSKVKKYINRSAMIAYNNGHKFFVLSYPWPAQLYKANTFNWVDFLKSSCLAPYCSGVIDATPEFNTNSPKYKYYLPGDMHFNRHGNEILANKVIKELNKLVH